MDRACVIGAGSSGIASCQVLHARGIPFDCVEAGSEIGGNWRYLNDNEMSSAYRSLRINTSRHLMEYRSFPMPEYLPDYPDHFQIAEYFDSYVDHFGFRDKIRFRTEVTHVQPLDGGYDVTVRSRDTGAEETLRYGAVLVANGHHWDARYPEPPFPGAETFTGAQTHSHHYKVPDAYVGKRVLVLGFGNSATDIAVETCRVSERTFLAMRRSAHVWPKFMFGRPSDRLVHPLMTVVLHMWEQRAIARALMWLKWGDQSRYGLAEPDHELLSAHPTISEDLLSRLGHGDITVKPDIERFDGDKVHFSDGSAEEIDAVIYCTGYKVTFPFLDGQVVTSEDNHIDLYKRVVAPEHPGLYFIGLVQPLGAIMPLAEGQSEWVADMLEGAATLPTPEHMHADIKEYDRRIAKRYVASKRHTIQVDFHNYLGELRKERKHGARRNGIARALPRAAANAEHARVS